MSIALAGSGDIHRCRATDGSVVFQDRPCEVATVPPGRRATTSPPISGRSPAPALPELHRPADERLLATCSERFLNCSGSNAQRMDACVAAIAPCAGGRSGGCCPTECIDRYQALRLRGEPLASAVRLALLDPNSPSCAAARSR